jgi:DNA-binding MurR/RpiR family transcriptional regulator
MKTPEEIALECMSPENVAGNVWNAIHGNFVAAIKQDRNNTLERAAQALESRERIYEAAGNVSPVLLDAAALIRGLKP